MQAQNIDYYELNGFLAELDLGETAADFHGLLSGLLVGKPLTANQCLEHTVNLLGVVDDGLSNALEPLLFSLHQQITLTLSDSNLSFSPLLPDDKDGIAVRISALTQWCQGFLAGLGSVCESDVIKEDSIKEMLHDISEISKAEPVEDDNEENEKFYMELVEYLRVAAMLLFNELSQQVTIQTDVASTNQTTLH